MPTINIDLSSAFTHKQSTSPYYDGNYPSSDRGGSGPSSGNSGTISYTAASGLSAGSEITLTAVGDADFGATGPEVVYFETLSTKAAAEKLGTNDHLGSAVVSVNNETYGGPEITLDPNLPNGKGIIVGRHTTAQTSLPNLSLNYAKANEFFEHQVTYWPQSHQDLAELDYGGAFNVKSVWHAYSGGALGNDGIFDVFLGGAQYVAPNWSGGEAFSGNDVEFNSDMGWSSAMKEGDTWTADPVLKQAYVKANTVAGNPVGSELTYKAISTVRGELSNQSTTDTVRVRGSGHSFNDGVVGFTQYPGYARGVSIAAGGYLMYSEQYIATGPNCRARVELCDTATPLATTKKIGIQYPKTWSSSAITFDVNESWWHLTGISGAYIHVYDGSGTFIGSVQV